MRSFFARSEPGDFEGLQNFEIRTYPACSKVVSSLRFKSCRRISSGLGTVDSRGKARVKDRAYIEQKSLASVQGNEYTTTASLLGAGLAAPRPPPPPPAATTATYCFPFRA